MCRYCFLSYDRKNQQVEFEKQKMIGASCFSEQQETVKKKNDKKLKQINC